MSGGLGTGRWEEGLVSLGQQPQGDPSMAGTLGVGCQVVGTPAWPEHWLPSPPQGPAQRSRDGSKGFHDSFAEMTFTRVHLLQNTAKLGYLARIRTGQLPRLVSLGVCVHLSHCPVQL